MNECLFFLHLLVVVSLILLALRLGKEALIACFSMQVVIANLFVIKQVHLFGLEITCCDVFIIGSMLTLQLLQEYHGRELAKKCVWIGFFSMLFFGVMSMIHLGYSPSTLDQTHASFSTILSKSPRILLASFLTFIVCQRLDIRLFAFAKKRLPQKSLFMRSGIVLLPTQLLDTILFTLLGLFGVLEHLGSIIMVSFTIKVCVIFLMSPLTLFSKRVIKA
ncbi:MAG: queuosine precursor transporter [Chlamydiia bacterium]|nr:queuosine precursor transporter [Chlamydiia bacterium]MCP5492767.1 queuosine precursor transporter [Chlamydiales bacterium]